MKRRTFRPIGQSVGTGGSGERHNWRGRTLPSFPAPPGHGPSSTVGLQGALAFLEGPASDWTVRDLSEWLDEHLVRPGHLKRPHLLREPGAAPVSLDARTDGGAHLEDLLTKARARVTAALRGLIAPVADDRFLHAAIYGGRVRRTAVNGRPLWIASPREIDFLGDMVLSLVAADILGDREFFRARLGLCDLCGRVTHRENPDMRAVCRDHRAATSGFAPRAG
ncbi:MAG: hypothetical protein IT372_01420 [Polyangiaceae bacterium]|nr:hypothetical protein [Polyangiaceae bacterium]